jgi:hypothetical protein
LPISVSVTHGATLLTRSPSRAHSHARLLASWLIAALLIAYRLPERPASGPPATLEINTTLEPPLARSTQPPPPLLPPLPLLPVASAAAPAASSGWHSWQRA